MKMIKLKEEEFGEKDRKVKIWQFASCARSSKEVRLRTKSFDRDFAFFLDVFVKARKRGKGNKPVM